MSTEYPQDAAPVKSHRGLKIVVATFGTAVVLTGAAFIGIPIANSIQQSAANTAATAAQALVPAAPVGSATTATEQNAMAQSDAAGAQAVATEDAHLAAVAAAAHAAAVRAAAIKAADEAQTTKCPAGTYAEGVDGNGNESNCVPENGSGEVCQAYNDANQCTSWGKP